MNEPGPTSDRQLAEQVGAKAARKLRARRNSAPGVWSGLGMMGLIGWSIVVPTLAGAALGLWLDAKYPGAHRWSLALLVAGLVLGCLNAWRWVAQQDRAMHAADLGGIPDGNSEGER
ncbi:MAG: AtpZ/AtpI family protein [Pseudomonadota bacterium]|nr:AtpZ/AtpI family protein [Pseudomonadota bacterium]